MKPTALERWKDGQAGEFLNPGRYFDIVFDSRRNGATKDGYSAFHSRAGHSLSLVRLDQH